MAMALNTCLLLFILFHFCYSKGIDLSCSQIQGFVNGHNSRRLKLANGEVPNQPAASEMKFMIWDQELAEKAAKWAAKEKFEHNPDRTIPSNRFTTGENMYMGSSTNMEYKLDVDGAVGAWFNEYKYYTYAPMNASHFSGSKEAVGHYTQVAWSNSIYLGCGASRFVDGRWVKYIVVCNYGPPGNWLGQTPYKSGSASKQLICAAKDCKRPYGEKC